MHISKRHIFACLACLGFALLPFSVCASPNPHDIILKLASESLHPQTANALQFLIPKGWNARNEGNDLTFHVPYHKGILGHIIQNNNQSQDELRSALEKTYHTELTEISREELNTEQLHGSKSHLSGLFGEETYTILLFTGSLPDQSKIVLYAIAPSHWFQSYEPLFLDILNSLHK